MIEEIKRRLQPFLFPFVWHAPFVFFWIVGLVSFQAMIAGEHAPWAQIGMALALVGGLYWRKETGQVLIVFSTMGLVLEHWLSDEELTLRKALEVVHSFTGKSKERIQETIEKSSAFRVCEGDHDQVVILPQKKMLSAFLFFSDVGALRVINVFSFAKRLTPQMVFSLWEQMDLSETTTMARADIYIEEDLYERVYVSIEDYAKKSGVVVSVPFFSNDYLPGDRVFLEYNKLRCAFQIKSGIAKEELTHMQIAFFAEMTPEEQDAVLGKCMLIPGLHMTRCSMAVVAVCFPDSIENMEKICGLFIPFAGKFVFSARLIIKPERAFAIDDAYAKRWGCTCDCEDAPDIEGGKA